MENTENTFVASQKKKQRRKRIRNLIILGVVIIILAAGGVTLLQKLNAEPASMSLLTYRAESVREGEISSTISGSGTLAATEAESFSSTAAATVEAVNFAPGERIGAGDIVLTLSSDELDAQLDTLTEQLDEVQTELAGTTQTRTNLNITAPKRGVVKDVQAAEGDTAEDLSYLCVISTDGKMKLVIDAPEGVKKYDAVTVSVDGQDAEGSVTDIEGGKATVVFKDDACSVGASAEVHSESGALLGSGSIEVNEHVTVKGYAGRIASVRYGENNRSVAKGTVLFVLMAGAPTSDYAALKVKERDLLDQIADLEKAFTVRAEYDCMLASLSVAAGDEISAGTALCTLSGSAGYTMSLSIDELDISSVALGQAAKVTLDALEGEFTGEVTDISYAGSGSYVTSYTVTVTTEPIEGALPGMSASVEIVTETSGSTLIVPVTALQYEEDSAFVYLCAGDVNRGTTVGEAELDLSTLTKVYVTAGMSDGSYIAVTSEGLSGDDLVWVPTLTTTAQYEADTTAEASFGFGSPQGGQMRGDGSGSERPSGDFSGERPGGSFAGGN